MYPTCVSSELCEFILWEAEKGTQFDRKMWVFLCNAKLLYEKNAKDVEIARLSKVGAVQLKLCQIEYGKQWYCKQMQ